MKKVKKALKEINTSLRKVDIFLTIVKSLVLLSFCYLLLYIVGINPYYALVPCAVYFFSSLILESRIDFLRRVEMQFKDLLWQLRTARDYQNKENIVLDELEEDILFSLKKVTLSSFLPFSKVVILLFLLIVSVSSFTYLASEDIQVIDFDSVIQNAAKRFDAQEEKESEEGEFTGGEVSVMEVGNERVEVEINPVGIDFDFNDVSREAEYDFSVAFPKDVFISSGTAYKSEFSDEQQALIKRYFDKKVN